MCATEDQRVDAALLETAKVGLYRHFRHLVVSPSLLHQRYKERTGATVDFNDRIGFFQRTCISAALDGRLSADNPDLLVSCTFDRPTHTWVNDRNHRDRQPVAQSHERDRGRVLQTTITSLTSFSIRNPAFSNEYRRTVSTDSVPWGARAVSPR
jgi:hypothetical protein